MTRIKPGEVFRMGDHIYGMCFDCHQLVKLTGFWKGLHICAEEPVTDRAVKR